MAYSIYGTVSPSSLELDGSHEDSKVLELWCIYLESHLHEHFKNAQKVDIKIVPFGGTRVFGEGTEAPSKEALRTKAEAIFDEFCFHLESIASPTMHLNSFPKLGDAEC